MQRIILAMLLYEREHGTFPPAFTVDADGKPLHSWRALLLPYLGERQLYDNLRLDEPWDSEHNRQYHGTTVAVYQCPAAATGDGKTNYTVIVGKDTPFGSDGKGKLAKDFSSSGILLAERRDAIPWMQPDAEISQIDAESGSMIGNLHYGGQANFGDLSGAVNGQHITDPDQLRKLIRGTAK